MQVWDGRARWRLDAGPAEALRIFVAINSLEGHNARVAEKTLEAWYCVPPDRDEPLVHVALAASGPVWGEIRLDADRLVLEVYSRSDGQPLVLPADELREVLRLAEEKL